MTTTPKTKDIWDKIEIAAKVIIGISIPIVTIIFAHFTTKMQSAPFAADVALRILETEPCGERSGIAQGQCRDEELDRFARYLIEDYTGFELSDGQVIKVQRSGNVLLDYCEFVCRDDLAAPACQANCKGLLQQ